MEKRIPELKIVKMVEFGQMAAIQKWYEAEPFPIYFIQGGQIYLKFSSPTDLLQIYGQDYGAGHWEWFSGKQVSPATFLEHLPENPSYQRILPAKFEAIQRRYLAFHQQLCAELITL